ncbi:MAG: hypothetical protein AAB412_05405 [Elusimicrobiota bacterium]
MSFPESEDLSVVRFCRTLAVLVLLLGAALRFAHLGAPLTNDEGYMLREYARRPISLILRRYDVPNNHILLSVLLHWVDRASPKKIILTLSDHRPLQLPGILAAAASLPLAYLLARTLLLPPPAILFFAAFFSLSFWHLLYSHMLRGYDLSLFLLLSACWSTAAALYQARPLRLAATSIALCLALMTLPTSAYFAAGLGIWTFCLPLLAPLPGPRRRVFLHVALAFGSCLLVSFLFYRPILSQVLQAGGPRLSLFASLAASPERWSQAAAVAGHGGVFRVFFLALASLGFCFALLHPRLRPAAALIGLQTLLPPFLATLQGTIPPSRVYIPSLPFWSMAAGLGAYAAFTAACRGMAALRSRPRPALSLALALILAASAGEIRTFLSCNRGVRPRDLLDWIVSAAAREDDFSILAAELGDRPLDAVAWDYYARASDLEPDYYLQENVDPPYLIRRRTFVLAEDEGQARAALARSHTGPILLGRLRRAFRSERLSVWETSLDAETLSACRSALQDRTSAKTARAGALALLGADALKRGSLKEGAALLEQAKALDPNDPRIRHQLGYAYFLGFLDEKAGAEFEWVVSHDTGNVHAPYYYAETLLSRGRVKEALRWYDWYLREDLPAAAWMLKRYAGEGAAATRSGEPSGSAAPDGPRYWRELGVRCFKRSSYERAAIALLKSAEMQPSLDRRVEAAVAYSKIHRYTDAIRLLEGVAEAGRGADAYTLLARMLILKHRYPEARRAVSEALRLSPAHAVAQDVLKGLSRLPDGRLAGT